jgi:hypothetical protein
MVSARIAPERMSEVVNGFSAAVRAGMPERRHTSLLRGEGGLWCIVTFWHSRADLDRYLAHAERPFAVSLLRGAGGEPRVQILEMLVDSTSTWWT